MKNILLIFLLIITNLLNAQTEVYQIISESEAKIQQQKDSIELQSLIDSANLGNSDKQLILGQMYRTGQRPDGSNIQVAQEIGILEYYSNSFVSDYKKALYWLLKSAKNNNTLAENDLGLMYDYGEGVPERGDSAFYWYSIAARKCLAEAQNNIARLYFLGKGVTKNYIKSYAWAGLAVDNGSAMAVKGMQMLKEALNDTEIEEAKKLKENLKKRLICDDNNL